MSVDGSGDLPARPWYLPGPEAEGGGPWHEAETGAGAAFRVPALEPGAAGELAQRVRTAAVETRRELPARRVIGVLSRAATRLADPGSRWGEEARALLAAELGWPESLAGETLARMSESWTADALAGLVEEELGGADVLDGFRPAPASGGGERRRRAAGPPLLLQVQAGNVPGVGVTGVIRALLVRSGVVARPSRDEPGLAALFARSLAAASPELGRTLAVAWWPRGADGSWEAFAKCSGKVVLYGGGSAVGALRGRLPAETELVAYGPKLGLAVFLPDAALSDAVRALARDVCAYEQRGCVSPRVAFVPEGRREEAARALHDALCDYVKQ
ncbi:MAG: acyl-CoA reductase, partial [Gemmatimonadota bacterium]